MQGLGAFFSPASFKSANASYLMDALEAEFPNAKQMTDKVILITRACVVSTSVEGWGQARIQDSTTGGARPSFRRRGGQGPKSQNFRKIIRVPLM